MHHGQLVDLDRQLPGAGVITPAAIRILCFASPVLDLLPSPELDFCIVTTSLDLLPSEYCFWRHLNWIGTCVVPDGVCTTCHWHHLNYIYPRHHLIWTGTCVAPESSAATPDHRIISSDQHHLMNSSCFWIIGIRTAPK